MARSGGLPTSEHYHVTLADALSAHDLALTYGGRPGMLDQGRLEAALARPYSGYRLEIWEKAAALVEAVTINHPFVDGNKRTAAALMFLLADKSGYRVEMLTGEDIEIAIEAVMVAAASGTMRYAALAEWFKLRLTPH
jgi:death on curing protein